MSNEFKLESIGQIHIGVKDIQRAIEFYRDVLGLTLQFEVPDQKMAFFDCGGIRLYLSADQLEDFPSNPLIYYQVADINEAFKAISGAGVKFEREPHIVHKTPEYDLWMAGFRDSEGNFIHLMNEAPPSG